MSTWAAVVLAGGQGKRMNSRIPKVLHLVAGKPMLRYAVEVARNDAPAQLVAVVPSGAEALRAALDDGVTFAEQPQPRGTGDALLCGLAQLSDAIEHVLVLGGDVPLLHRKSVALLKAHHVAQGARVTLLTSALCPPDGLGRVLRDDAGRVSRIVEHEEAGADEQTSPEVNAGVYAFDVAWLRRQLPQLRPRANGEVYLTDLVALAYGAGEPVETVASQDPWEALGVNTRVQLAQAEKAMRQRICQQWMLAGVTLVDPESTFIDADVQLGQDTVVYPHTELCGRTQIGRDCHIGPHASITDSTIGDGCQVRASSLEGAHLEDSVRVGPYSHLRPGAYLERDVYIGNYAEVKNSRIGRGTHMGHFSYVGDATVGPSVNIGAGAITCNYDGVTKHRTVIEEGAFIGSSCMLVAPVRVGARSATGAGSVVTRDVPADSLVAGVPARLVRRRQLQT